MYLITRGDSIGGAQVHVRDLAVRAHDEGNEVVVVTGIAGPLTEQLAERGVRSLICPGMLREISPHKDLGAIRAFRDILRAEKPDLVSTHSSKAGIVGRIGARWAGVKVIFTAHGWAFTGGVPQPKRSIYKAIERIHEPLASRIVCVSAHDRTIGIAAGMSADRLVTIHNGMPEVEPELRAKPAHPGPVRAVMTARFDRQKDHETLFRAMTNLPDLQLDLIGNGPDLAATEALARELNIHDRVSFLGQRADVSSILANAHIFVLSSRWEGFPRSTLEAMRAGLPVVVSNVGGAAEAVTNGETGFVVHPGDREELGERLRDLVRSPDLRGQMGAAGRLRFDREFTFDIMYGKTRALYGDVLRDSVDK